MTIKLRLLLALVALAVAPGVFAGTTSIGWQFGIAHNKNVESNFLVGSTTNANAPEGRKIDKWEPYVGVQLYYHVSDRLAFGIGTRLVADRWPMDQSHATWELDVMGIEYRLFGRVRLRAAASLDKTYEQRSGYGRGTNLSLVGPLTRRLDWGLDYVYADANEEYVYGTNYKGGKVRVWALYLEYQMGQ